MNWKAVLGKKAWLAYYFPEIVGFFFIWVNAAIVMAVLRNPEIAVPGVFMAATITAFIGYRAFYVMVRNFCRNTFHWETVWEVRDGQVLG